MKRLLLTAIAAMPVLLMSAQTLKNYEQGNPKDENYDYLKDYAPLKNYIDKDKYPNFRLGGAIIVYDYLSNPSVAGMINDNFTETVAGNAMKMSSCVSNDGNMDFTNVKRFVEATQKAGINLYGHTLAWHSQQPNGWLRGLIKDKAAVPFENPDTVVDMTVASKDFRYQQNVGWTADQNQFGYSLSFSNKDGLKIHTTKICPNQYDVQFLGYTDIPIDAGKTYTFIFEIKGTDEGKMHSRIGNWDTKGNTDFSFTTDWTEVAVKYDCPVDNPFLMLQCGDFVGDIFIRSIRVQGEVGAMKVTDDRRCLKVAATAKQSDAWDNQFWVVPTSSFKGGQSFEFTLDVRADKAAKAATQIHNEPGDYVHYAAFGDINFTTEWKTINVKGKFEKGGKSIAFNLNDFSDANTYYFDNLSLKIDGEETLANGSIDDDDVSSFKMKLDRGGVDPAEIYQSNFYLTIPQKTPRTKEEKLEILSGAMEKWIKAMMEACDGKVKAWDVVNEAISGGGNDGQGNYTLQHSNGFNGEATWDVGGESFFWQDHMGDLEYVRSAVKYARKYGPKDIKLFINDYNLESDWDGNQKVKSLINWIKKWEADGETYIDGIGTQMHLSYYEDAGTLASKKKTITKMFELMAATGKLVRVSEFDMGYVNAKGQDVATGNMTEEQHQNMADYTEWIISEYLRLIPAEQQWAFCFWCPTDAPANSGWRANTPVGIFTTSLYRKHVYAGVVRGLGGVEYTTGVDEIEAPVEVSHGIYTINGMKVSDNTKFSELPAGLYIVDGKKVVKK